MIGDIGCGEGCWLSTSSSRISSLCLLCFLLLSSSSWCQNTKRYAFSGHFYRSIKAPRLSDFLHVDLELNNDNSKYNDRLSYTVSSPSLKSVEFKKMSRSEDV